MFDGPVDCVVFSLRALDRRKSNGIRTSDKKGPDELALKRKGRTKAELNVPSIFSAKMLLVSSCSGMLSYMNSGTKGKPAPWAGFSTACYSVGDRSESGGDRRSSDWR